MIQAIGLVAAYFIDRLVGDPRWLPHPVIWIGKMIEMVEKGIRKCIARESSLKAAGVVLVVIIVGGSYLLVWGLLELVAIYIDPTVSLGLGVWIISTTMATTKLTHKLESN